MAPSVGDMVFIEFPKYPWSNPATKKTVSTTGIVISNDSWARNRIYSVLLSDGELRRFHPDYLKVLI